MELIGRLGHDAMLTSPAVEWPEEFYALKRGEGCAMCSQGRPDETEWGVRFFAGQVSDAYLQKSGIQRGYSIVIGGLVVLIAMDLALLLALSSPFAGALRVHGRSLARVLDDLESGDYGMVDAMETA